MNNFCAWRNSIASFRFFKTNRIESYWKSRICLRKSKQQLELPSFVNRGITFFNSSAPLCSFLVGATAKNNLVQTFLKSKSQGSNSEFQSKSTIHQTFSSTQLFMKTEPCWPPIVGHWSLRDPLVATLTTNEANSKILQSRRTRASLAALSYQDHLPWLPILY